MEENIYKDKQSQIDAINRTFEEALLAVTQHHSKKDVFPVDQQPVFPDFQVRSTSN